MSSTDAGFSLLDGKSLTPIPSLSPDLPNQSSCAVSGEVTIIWPFNSRTGILAFRLVDRNAHRRRVQFQGSAAKAVAALNLRAGDPVAIALDGAEWIGSPADWELQFSEKLTLQARVGDARELKEVTIDHPTPEQMAPVPEPPAPPAAEEAQMTAAPANGEPSIPIINPITMELDEYPSPAFMKRARLSYGALFEDPEEKFEDDGGVRGKGRKRTRFGRDSSSWRYASQSRSPTPEAEPKTPAPTAEAAVEVEIIKPSPPKPQMADEGVQTMDIEMAPSPVKRQITEVPPNDTTGRQPSSKHQEASNRDQQSQPSQPDKSPKTPAVVETKTKELAFSSPALESTVPDKQPATPNVHAPPKPFGSNTLFGNYVPSHSGYDHPRFGTASSASATAGLDFANQVRFGFSHTPQQEQQQQLSHSASAPQRVGEDVYPESHLEPSDPSKYADMKTYVDQAEQEMEMEPQYAYAGNDLNPPVAETFGNGQYDMATQGREYNPVEGGHFGADALDEGFRITTGGNVLHSDEIDVDKVPPGFSSYGGGLEHQIIDEDLDAENANEEEDTHVPGEDFVENDEVEDDLDDEVGLEDRDDTEYGPEGEIIEQGDYDQREYAIPEEDDDELSEEENQAELQALTQDNNPDVVDEDELINDRMDDNDEDEEDVSEEDGEEDEEGSSDEEDEGGYDEAEEDQGSYEEEEGSSESEGSDGPDYSNAYYDNVRQMWVQRGQPLPPLPPTHSRPVATSGPVVIDLLSDSDDDEPPAKPAPKPVSTPSEPVAKSDSGPSQQARQDPTPTRQDLNTGDQHDAVLEPSPAPEQHPAQGDTARRKSSGSHMYGETAVGPYAHSPSAGLHLPSTPPPDKRDTRHEVTNEDHDTASIPSFNGAAESRVVDSGTTKPESVTQDERGEEGPSVAIGSSVPRSASYQSQKEETGAQLPEPSDKDGEEGLRAQTVHPSEDQEMPDAVVSRPLSSVGDADDSEAGSKSTGLSKRDVAEVERLFEEVNTPTTNEDVTMGGNQPEPEPVPENTGSAKESTPQPEQTLKIREEPGATERQGAAENVDNDSGEKDIVPQDAPSSPLGSFASQVFSSSPARKENIAQLPTPMDTQPNQSFLSQASMSDMPLMLSTSQEERTEEPAEEPTVEEPAEEPAVEEPAEESTEEPAAEEPAEEAAQEPAEVRAEEPAEEPVEQLAEDAAEEAAEESVEVTETIVKSHVHVEEQVSIPAEEDGDGEADDDDEDVGDVSIEMTDAPAEDETVSSPAADQDLTMVDDADLEEDMDDETLIASQLQVEIVRTTVQHGDERLTVVQETRRRVSVSHASSGDVSAADRTPALEQEADQVVETDPVDNVSAEDAPVEDTPIAAAAAEDAAHEDALVEDTPSVVDAADEAVSDEDAAVEDAAVDAPLVPASLEDAIQEELLLEDTLDDELASQFGKQDNASDGEDDDEEIEDLTGDDDENIVDEEVDVDADYAEPMGEETTEAQEEPAQEKPSLEDAAQDDTPAEAQRGPPQLMSEETVKSTIAVLPDDDEVVLVGEEETSEQEPTTAVVAEEADMVSLDKENPAQMPEAEALPEDIPEVTADPFPPKEKQDLEVLIRPHTRSRRTRGQQTKSDEVAPREEDPTQQSAKEPSPDVVKASKRATSGPRRTTRATENRDPSIELAKASIQKRSTTKRKLEPVPLEPRRTRQRSASQAAAPHEEVEEEEDSSIALAKAALESPSKKRSRSKEPSVASSATTSRDLLRRLRITLAEFTPLKSLRHHKKGHPHILAVIACDPPEPHRTKHRDYHTTVTVTDASIAPDQVVAVQFTELHSAYLPAVKQGDTIVLRNFEIISLPGREFALRQQHGDDSDSYWAVYGADNEVPGGRGGPDVEMQEAIRDYLHDLRVWYNDMEVADREKLVTAVTRLSESSQGDGGTG
ncbi:hypothetical protein GE09DRAFT_1289127 [Coniochaeta sp. 2T2.1]|nr:hypothetical protein GE09DRAFT_1289127 [Coniochaeta sp. 2T2.1]